MDKNTRTRYEQCPEKEKLHQNKVSTNPIYFLI